MQQERKHFFLHIVTKASTNEHTYKKNTEEAGDTTGEEKMWGSENDHEEVSEALYLQ